MSDESDLIDYRTWGEHFFTSAVTAERVVAGVNVLAGRPIEVGRLGVGPGRVAQVKARGSIGTATGERSGGDPFVFHVDLPVALEFQLDLALDKMRFEADITVPLVITARGRTDLAIVLDVDPPGADQVACDLRAHGLRATLTSRVAGIEDELRRFVAKYVARELQQPHVLSATVIDVGAAIDRAAASVGPRPVSPMADHLSGTLPAAMEADLDTTRFLPDDPSATEEIP